MFSKGITTFKRLATLWISASVWPCVGVGSCMSFKVSFILKFLTAFGIIAHIGCTIRVSVAVSFTIATVREFLTPFRIFTNESFFTSVNKFMSNK